MVSVDTCRFVLDQRRRAVRLPFKLLENRTVFAVGGNLDPREYDGKM
jgi:hypothetical protein